MINSRKHCNETGVKYSRLSRYNTAESMLFFLLTFFSSTCFHIGLMSWCPTQNKPQHHSNSTNLVLVWFLGLHVHVVTCSSFELPRPSQILVHTLPPHFWQGRFSLITHSQIVDTALGKIVQQYNTGSFRTKTFLLQTLIL